VQADDVLRQEKFHALHVELDEQAERQRTWNKGRIGKGIEVCGGFADEVRVKKMRQDGTVEFISVS